MKIYFIGQKGIPMKYGGVEKHVEELAVRLVDAGHNVFAYTRPNYTDKNLKEYKGVNLISLPTIGTKHLDAISHTFFACLDVIRRDADIIHFHSIGPSSLIWLVRLLKPRTPVIATFHTRCYEHKKWGIFAKAYLKLGELSICFLPNTTITVSRSLTEYAKNKYKKETKYIPNGVELPLNINTEKEIKKWNLKKGEYILTVSRLIRHKGIHHLIEAYKNLKTDKKLVIVGDGSFTETYVKYLKELARGNENIIFTGNQTGSALSSLFANAYLFVQPSESEGLSVALLEAMSYGLATLVSDIAENKEAIENTGYVFKNKNVDDLTEKLKYLLEHQGEIEKSKELGLLRVKKFYNWENIVKETLDIYNDVAVLKVKEENLATKQAS